MSTLVLPIISEKQTAPADTQVPKTDEKKDTPVENKEEKSLLRKYQKYVYGFFAASATLMISYFAYRRFKKN